MEKYEIQKLRDLPIEGVAERIGLRVARHKSLCPFHDDHHASLVYNTRRNTCRCFVCMKESMGTIDLVMRHLGLDFPKACQWLADANSIILTEWKPTTQPQTESQRSFDASRYGRLFEHPWLNGAARRFLFDERRIHPRVAAWCRLTSWTDRQGVNWLTTPYYDRQGNLIGVQNRNLDYSKTADVPRFRFPRGARCSIYNLPVVNRLKAGDELFITEGCSDCWAMLSWGVRPSPSLLPRCSRKRTGRRCARSAGRNRSRSTCFPTAMLRAKASSCSCATCCPGLCITSCPWAARTSGRRILWRRNLRS